MYFISSNENMSIEFVFLQGYMPDDLKAEALSKIHKQCIGCVEQSMKLLEFLDSLVSLSRYLLVFLSLEINIGVPIPFLYQHLHF